MVRLLSMVAMFPGYHSITLASVVTQSEICRDEKYKSCLLEILDWDREIQGCMYIWPAEDTFNSPNHLTYTSQLSACLPIKRNVLMLILFSLVLLFTNCLLTLLSVRIIWWTDWPTNFKPRCCSLFIMLTKSKEITFVQYAIDNSRILSCRGIQSTLVFGLVRSRKLPNRFQRAAWKSTSSGKLPKCFEY